jgi:aspartyl-tRNA(Asn)/glutamyl-tRNA(Gln) amidotransferase subunit B
VSEPEIHSGLEASDYVEKIRSIVTFTDVSNGKMEEGTLRCDVNISLRPIGSATLGTKVEVKNINSISNVAKAIDYEIKRQSEVLLSGQPVIQETRRFDDSIKETLPMRLKTDSVDYKYFTEPNLVPTRQSAIESCPELAERRYERYLRDFGLSEYDATLLIASPDQSNYFDQLVNLKAPAKMAANWLNGEISAYLNKNQIELSRFPIESSRLAELLVLIDQGHISHKQGRELFSAMLESKDTAGELVKKMGLAQISDQDALMAIVDAVLDENAQSIVDYKAGKDRALGYLVGQIMKKTQGKANPGLASSLVKQALDKR